MRFHVAARTLSSSSRVTEEDLQMASGRRRTLAFISTAILFTLAYEARECDDIASIQATEDVCRINENGTACSLNTNATLNIPPDGSVGCLTVEDEDRFLEAKIEIQVVSLVSECVQKSHYFARDFHLKYYNVHRCWKAGSCQPERCEGISKNTTIDEFTDEAKRSPGFSQCWRSCGCVFCGCPSCTPACLFNRIYAIPKNLTVYEVLTCPEWRTTIEISVNIDGIVGKHRLEHGIPFLIPGSNVTTTITGFSTPSNQIHNSTFIKRLKLGGYDETFAFTHTPFSHKGTPTNGTIGEFQCSTLEDANKFRCDFDEKLCDCSPGGTRVSCNCKSISLHNVISTGSLPHEIPGGSVVTENGTIVTKIAADSLVSIHLQFTNQIIRRVVEDGDCTVSNATVSGCYSCDAGAEVNAKCISKKYNRIRATVQCPTLGDISMECSRNGTPATILFHSDSQTVNETCEVSCGATVSHFSFAANLSEVTLFNVTDASTAVNRSEGAYNIGDFFNGVFEAITDAFKAAFGFLLFIITAPFKDRTRTWVVIVAIFLVLFACLLIFVRWGCCRQKSQKESTMKSWRKVK